MVKKGEEGMMRQWIWSVIPMLLVGCVSSGEYERVQNQYEHLKEVKTEWETEKDDLQQGRPPNVLSAAMSENAGVKRAVTANVGNEGTRKNPSIRS